MPSNYELVYVAKQDLSPNDVDALTAKFKKILEENGGKLVSKEYWGLKNLAYKINKNQRGHYVLMNIETEFPALKELERIMGLNESVIRTGVFKVRHFSEEPSVLFVSTDAKDYKTGRSDLKRNDNNDEDLIQINSEVM